MEKTITREFLKDKLYSSGTQSAIELLYTKYSDMLYSYILQFIPERQEADDLLVRIFTHLSGRLEEACDSTMSIYCWLQAEARKIILHYKSQDASLPLLYGPDSGADRQPYYFSLLKEATNEQLMVFRELFLLGRHKEELARQLDKDAGYIDRVLRESLVIMGRNLEMIAANS